MAEKKVVRYKLVRHKWPDEIQAEKKRRQRRMCIVATCIVCFFGGFFLNSTLHQTAAASRDEFQKLEEIYSIMSDKFYFGKNQKNLNQKLIDGAISGLVDAGGDIHTSYLDNEQTESFTGSMEGSFVGIGIQFYGVDDSTFIIDEVLKNSPAEGAGFLMGDQIYAIDGTVCRNMTTSDVKALITNSKSDEITLEIIRENRHKKIKVKKATVQDSVYSSVNGKTGILELDTFAETSGEEVKSHLESLKKDGCENLILDLRDNTGGYLKSTQEIASYLLPDNTVIFREETKDGTKEDYKTISGYEQYKYKKIVVLVNGDTASAAEVLTAALREHLGATVVGEKTYGKGTVQVPLTFKDGTMFKYTTAEWITPKGEKINGKGITPDVQVKLDEAFYTSAPVLKKEVYKPDTVSAAAKSAQIYLKFLGYAVDRTDEYFSYASGEALKQYQKDKGMKVTGNIDADTLTSLLSSCALKWHSEEAVLDTQMKKAVELTNGN
ncbi:S41 family peptidase [[Clostridium] innocuum]|nr:S41 family peptidase [[Clostridium] innocuum]